MDVNNTMTPAHQQAQLHLQAGQLPEAEQLYRQALVLTPNIPAIHLEYSNVLLQQGKHPEALQALESAYAQFPGDDGITAALGTLVANLGNPAKGLELINVAIQQCPSSVPAHCSLACIYQQTGQINAALTAAHTAVQHGPDNPEARYLLGNLLTAHQQNDAAIEAFEHTVRLAPQWIPPYLQLGALLEAETRYEAALNCFQQVKAIAPAYDELDKKIGLLLHAVGRIDEAEQQFRKALTRNNDDADLYVMLGNTLRDQERVAEAKESYRTAQRLAPDNKVARQNLQQLNQVKISQWHFDMLADTARNDAFDQALRKAVTPDAHVLDIGTGSGLLAMMAARAGAQQVTGCEMVPALAEVSQRIIQANRLDDRIKVLNKKSTSMTVGEDIPDKADLLVSEILDVGLLGEGVLPTLRHAWANLLQPNATIIPKAADIYGVLIESAALKQVNPVGLISGFDLSEFNHFRAEGGIQSVELNSVEHRPLSEMFPIQSFDFKHLPPATSEHSPNTQRLEVTINQSGQIHAIAFWFALHLDDEITVSTAPDGEMKHWKQALYFFPNTRPVKQGQRLLVEVQQFENRLQFQLVEDSIDQPKR